jgi:hypothetical protein
MRELRSQVGRSACVLALAVACLLGSLAPGAAQTGPQPIPDEVPVTTPCGNYKGNVCVLSETCVDVFFTKMCWTSTTHYPS